MSRRSSRSLALLAMAVALSGNAPLLRAQSAGAVQGTVVDSASARPVPGVQVSVVGTSRGTMTDESGRFIIRSVPPGSATVRAQRIGYAPRTRQVTIVAGETAAVDFTLSASAAVLSEVVVVGYGTRSRAEVSSAVAQVSGEAIHNTPVAGIDAALQGKAPGVQIVQNAGNPGNGITVRVRGSSSISASNQPLYVVDGIPIIREDLSQLDFGGQDLTAITGLSPDEIESIDILKDAAAAAIYGSRASNGVVMITTRRGRAGPARFTFNTYFGQQEILRKIDLMSSKEYVEYMNEAATNDGYDAFFTPGVDDTVETDWQTAVLRTAPVVDHNLSVDGGGDRFRYLLSTSFFDQQGIIRGSSYDRFNSRLNLDLTATPKLQFRSSIGLSREQFERMENDNTIEGAGANALANAPNLPVFRPGTTEYFGTNDGLSYANSVALAAFNRAPSSALRLLGSLETSYDATDRIRLNVRVGADAYNLQERRWDSPRVEGTYASGAVGVATQATNTATKYIGELYGTWEALQTGSQRLTLTAGTSSEYNRTELVYLRGEGFGSDAFQYPGNAGKVTEYDGHPSQNNLFSVFSRASYTLMDRYLFTGSLRTDGSSRFARDVRFGVFPAVSFGWRLTDEPAFGAVKRLMDAKLRVSYGETGNQAIPTNFGFLTAFARANYAGAPGIAAATLGNENLKWETTREFDVGADFGFLDNRISVITDYYRKETSDLLVQRPIASVSGFSSIWDNVGNVENRGVELQVSTQNVRAAGRDGFSWTTDVNVSHNRNEVTALFKDEPFNSGIRGVSRVQVGHPIGAFYTVKFTNVDPQTGEAKYEDIAGPDGSGPDGEITADDRQVVGSPHPDYFGGVRNQLSWRGLDLNTFLEFSQGQEVFNLFRLFSDDAGYYFDNKVGAARNRWQKPGDITDQPRASYDGASNAYDVSSRFIEDGSYVRLGEVTLGYRLPTGLLARTGLSDSRVYVSGRNLALWTKYTGYDPDVNSHGSSSNTALGVDFYSYPRARTITLGLSGSW